MLLRRVCLALLSSCVLVLTTSCATPVGQKGSDRPALARRTTATPLFVRSAPRSFEAMRNGYQMHHRTEPLVRITPQARARAASAVAVHHVVKPRPQEVTVDVCGGALPPCYVLHRESHGDPFAVEPGHLGAPYGDPGDPYHHASGAWQFMPGTWNNYAGYPYAAAAPISVQNAKAIEVWDGGRGCSHWSAC